MCERADVWASVCVSSQVPVPATSAGRVKRDARTLDRPQPVSVPHHVGLLGRWAVGRDCRVPSVCPGRCQGRGACSSSFTVSGRHSKLAVARSARPRFTGPPTMVESASTSVAIHQVPSDDHQTFGD